MRKRGLITVTSTASLPSGAKTGFWLPEAAYPWRALATEGWDFEFLSTADGEPPIAGTDPSDPPQRWFLRDPEVRGKLAATRTAAAYDPADFSIVFVAGGPGAMWDFPRDEALAAFLAACLEAKTVVTAVCHGPAALIGVRAADGAPAVRGLRLTGFSNREEEAIGMADQVPFRLADALSELGADYQAGENFRSHVVQDGLLVTGQNPASAARATELGMRLASGAALPANWLRRPHRGRSGLDPAR